MSAAKPRQTESCRPSGHWTGCLFALLLGCAVVTVSQAQVRLPDFNDSSAGAFSGADDRRLGEAFMREIRATVDILEDPVVEEYVQTLGYKLTSVSDYSASSFNFFVVNDSVINAFAGPGGNIGINTGLILAAEFEGELASVVAHEIAHVTQRHIARAIELAGQTSVPVLAGILAAAIVGIANPQAGQATIAAVTGASIQSQLDFTRANEREADRVGMQLLSDAGFDPQAMPAFFEKLQTATRFSRRPPEYLSTHPVTSNRVADSRARAAQFPYKQHADSVDFHLVKSRLRIMGAKDVAAETEALGKQLQSGAYRNLAGTAYGWGLGLLRQGKGKQAEEVFAKLRKQHPQETAFIAALGESVLAQGRTADAIEILGEGADLFPDDRVLLYARLDALLRAGQGDQALKAIESYARLHSKTARLYNLEAKAYQQTGAQVRAQLALAEYFYLSGNVAAAMQQLRQATARRDADYFVSSRAAARLNDLQREQAERAGKR